MMKTEHSKTLRFHFNCNYFQLKTYVLPIFTCNVSSNFWTGWLETYVSCIAWCRNGETLKTAQPSRDHHQSNHHIHPSAGPLEPPPEFSSDLIGDAISSQVELDRRQVDQVGQAISEGSGSF